jgi:hypothetical protein
MPIFRSNKDIFMSGEEESFDHSKFDIMNKFVPPLNKEWDYSKELHVENVELWEVIYEEGSQIGVYAAWEPYAEFYMIINKTEIFTYYGKGALKKTVKKIKELKFPISYNKQWVSNDHMWLYK